MKKIIALSLCLVMLFSFTACNNKGDEQKTGTTIIVTEGDAKMTTNVVENEDGTVKVELTSDMFDSLEGNVVGVQCAIRFKDATFVASETPDYPEGWSATITGADKANEDKEAVVVLLDDNLASCFPNQKIADFTFKDLGDNASIEVANIKLVYYVDNNLTDNKAIRCFVQDNFTVYPKA